MNLLSRINGRIGHHYYQIMNKLYSRRCYIDFQREWFKSKRVAIIGGADSAFKEKKGAYIDGFDVVVRINKGVEMIRDHSQYIGTRTNVLFHCFFENVQQSGSPITPMLWRDYQVERVIKASLKSANTASLNSFYRISNGNVKYSELPPDILDMSSKSINGYVPTTGFLAIHAVLASQPEELFITGITFLKTPHSKDYRDISLSDARRLIEIHNTHNTDLEFKWFQDVYDRSHGEIAVDKCLAGLLS